MAAKIGILGEATVTAVGLNWAYVVPAGKAAKIRVLFAHETGNGASGLSVIIGGTTIQNFSTSLVSGVDLYTGVPHSASIDPSAGSKIIQGAGLLQLITGSADNPLLMPLPVDYYLSAGNAVIYEISTTAPFRMIFQVIGVEDDA